MGAKIEASKAKDESGKALPYDRRGYDKVARKMTDDLRALPYSATLIGGAYVEVVIDRMRRGAANKEMSINSDKDFLLKLGAADLLEAFRIFPEIRAVRRF